MTARNAVRIDLYLTDGIYMSDTNPEYMGVWRWRLWKGSRIVGASSEGYTERRGAVANLETVLGGEFVKTSTPDAPAPYGSLIRWNHQEGVNRIERIPVRLVLS